MMICTVNNVDNSRNERSAGHWPIRFLLYHRLKETVAESPLWCLWFTCVWFGKSWTEVKCFSKWFPFAGSLTYLKADFRRAFLWLNTREESCNIPSKRRRCRWADSLPLIFQTWPCTHSHLSHSGCLERQSRQNLLTLGRHSSTHRPGCTGAELPRKQKQLLENGENSIFCAYRPSSERALRFVRGDFQFSFVISFRHYTGFSFEYSRA